MDYVSWLVWEYLSVPPDKLEKVASNKWKKVDWWMVMVDTVESTCVQRQVIESVTVNLVM